MNRDPMHRRLPQGSGNKIFYIPSTDLPRLFRIWDSYTCFREDEPFRGIPEFSFSITAWKF